MVAALAGTGAGYVTTATAASGTSLTVAKPSALADGHTMIAVLNNSLGTASWSAPTGWTKIASHTGTQPRTYELFARAIPKASDETVGSYIFTSTGSGRNLGAIFLVSGVDSASPLDVISKTSPTAVSLTAPAVTPTAPGGLAVYCCFGAHTTTAITWTPPAGMTEVADLSVGGAGASSSNIEVAAQQLADTAASGTRTATASTTPSGQGALLAVLRAGTVTPPPPAVALQILGGVTPAGFRATVRATNASSARVAVSTSATMTARTYGPAATVGTRGYAVLSSPTLGADTEYYWAVELDGTLQGLQGRVRTLPAAGTPASFSFAAGSCARTNSNHQIFDAIRTRTGPTTRRATFFAHLGDMHYLNLAEPGPPTLDQNIAAFEGVLGQSAQAQLYREIPLVYTESDHDAGGSNVDGSNANMGLFQQAYRLIFPHYDLVPDSGGDGAGIYHAFGVGRVLFLVTDGRSYMTSPLGPDSPSRTKLGTAQKAWLKGQLVRTDYPIKIILADCGWNNRSTYGQDATQNSQADDTWSGYATERAEIGTFVAAQGVRCLYVHGDFHALAADSGVGNLWGGFPLVCCSPLDQTSYAGNGTWSQGSYPNPVSAITYSQQYGWFDVEDLGNKIAITFTGYDSGGTARVAMTTTWHLGAGWGQTL